MSGEKSEDWLKVVLMKSRKVINRFLWGWGDPFQSIDNIRSASRCRLSESQRDLA
jgi:hypothetical protein